ncbi:MAG: hypothetical protein C0602_01840 [Denitrovibrio sp.]|nr:MAG: hypothetical protein C0602_01840 [Denitrovibrio sp.]
MEIYLVYLDFKHENNSLNEITAILNEYEGIRFQPFGWLIKTDEIPSTICSKLSYLCETDNYFMVTPLHESFCCKQPDKIIRWIKANI